MVGAFLVAALLAVALAGLNLGSAVVARHRAQSAADLAALAGAAVVPAGVDTACASAAAVVRAMRAKQVECSLASLDLIVRVQVSVAVGQAQAAARAGPG